MSNEADIANAFYGAPASPAKPSAPAPSADQTTADILFGDTSKAKAAQAPPSRTTGNVDVQSDRDMAEVVFRDSPIHGNALRVIESAAQRESLATPEQASEIAHAWLPRLQGYELNASESAQLADLGVSMTLNPPDAATAAVWADDAKNAIREEFGDRAGEALESAQRLIARDPEVVQFLERTGLGNSKRFVIIACKKAMSLKARGKL